MAFVGERCFKFHRIMFIAMGLWPYQKPFIWRIQAVFFFAIYFCFLGSQLLTFVTTACNMDCILKRFSYVCISLVYILNYYSFYFNSKYIKKALHFMQLDWRMFKNSDGMKIFEKYLFESYALIIFLSSISVLVIYECVPVILDIFEHINQSRSHKIEVDFEFFVSIEQYFFLYLMQEILGVGVGICSIITTATFLATIGQHCCATYKIAGHLIQNAVTVNTLQLSGPQRMQFMYRSICLSVHIHRRTMQFVEGLIFSFNFWYFPLLLLGVLSLSCILFRLYNAIMQFDDFYNILICCLILCGYLMYMFMTNFYAHSYMEHSSRILEATYDTLWYVAPLSIQKLFLIMLKSIKCHKIVVGGFFVPSIEGFSKLMTTAISYFTMMHAMSL